MREGGTTALPEGLLAVNTFNFFNAVSFQIILGAPVVLYAKSLGATSFVLGVIAALTPVLTILQLVAARHLHRTGYRKLVLAGWGSRTVFTFFLAALPLLSRLSPWVRLAFLLFALFAYNALRGFASGAWLPWLTAIVPEEIRGRFLSRDQACTQAGGLVALLVSAGVMSKTPDATRYAAMFGIGAAMALVSLWFIRRIPEAASPEEVRRSAVRVPWMAMMRHAPFARLLMFSTLYSIMIGGLGVFAVEFLIVREKFGGDLILLLGSTAFLGALVGLAATGPWFDEMGSKPWLGHALVAFGVVIAGWLLLALQVFPAWAALVGGLNFLGGLAGAVFGVASTRIAMSSVPVMGRNHFFALYTVVTGLGLGGAPMAWGALLDTLGAVDRTVGGLSVNRYSIYFAALLGLAVLVRSLVGFLHEGVPSEESLTREK